MSMLTANTSELCNMPPMGLHARIVLSLLPWTIALASLLGVYYVDTLWMPVKDFTISKVVSNSEGYSISGTMDRNRTCEFKGLTVYGHPVDGSPRHLLPYSFLKEAETKHRSLGVQAWGPWQVMVSMKPEDRIHHLEFAATHQCIGPWVQTHTYAYFKVPQRD